MEHFLKGFVLLRHWYINIHKFSLLKRINGALPSWKCSIKAPADCKTSSLSHGVIFFLLKLNDYFLILRWRYIVYIHMILIPDCILCQDHPNSAGILYVCLQYQTSKHLRCTTNHPEGLTFMVHLRRRRGSLSSSTSLSGAYVGILVPR